MNAVNHALNSTFDVLLRPLELLGRVGALVAVSAVFGVLALFVFKHISSQRRIRAVKGRIKGHLIEVYLFQDDPRLALRAIGRVLLRNLQYLGLNVLPLVPLAIPFTFVAAQLVTRYGFDPVPVKDASAHVMPGQGTLIQIEVDAARAALVADLALRLPAGVEPLSPLVRIPSQGKAFQEIVARASGAHELTIELGDGTRTTKRVVAGSGAGARPAPALQAERANGFFHALLWPAEDTLESSAPIVRIAAEYPEADLAGLDWVPSGPGGVLLIFLVASMVAGALAMKPLKVSI